MFPALEESLAISYSYVSLVLVMFLLREYYYRLIFTLRCSRVVGSRCSHQRRPVILDRFLTVFNLIFVSLSFLFMSRSHILTLSWSSLTLLDDWTFAI